ncbi:MAG: EpsG family protein [Tsuneonella sp.]
MEDRRQQKKTADRALPPGVSGDYQNIPCAPPVAGLLVGVTGDSAIPSTSEPWDCDRVMIPNTAPPLESEAVRPPLRFAPGPGVIAVASILWGYLFVAAAMSIRPLEQWEDLFGYVRRFSIDPYSGMTIPQSVIDYPLAEYGWQLLIRFFFYQGTNFETAFFIMSVAAVAAVTYVALKRTRNPFVLVIFINPAMLDFFISQGRSALAFAIMLLFYFRSLPVAIAGIALAATIHTSMGLMLVPLAIELVRRRTFGDREDSAGSHFWPLVAVGAAVLLAIFQIFLLDFVGDRRSDYAVDNLGGGILFALGWTLVGVIFYICNGSRSRLEGIAAMFFVALFASSSALNLYSHRYIAYFLPFMALAIGSADTPKERRILFLAAYALFSIVYFAYWL